jgi:hypothetical protein
MAFGTITSTENTFGSVDGTTTGVVPGTLTGSVGVPGPAGPGVPAGGTTGQFLAKTSDTDYATGWTTLSLSGYATESWVTSGFYPLTGNPSSFLDSAVADTLYYSIDNPSGFITSYDASVAFYPLSGNPSSFLVAADIANKADLASPALTGTPTAPTASPGTDTTQLATTAFVTAAVPALATLSDARQFTNDTKVMSPRDVLWSMLSQDFINIDGPSMTTTNTGTISAVQLGQLSRKIRPGNAGACSSRIRTFGSSQVDQTWTASSRAQPSGFLNFSLRSIHSGRSTTQGVTDANYTCAVYYGKAETDGVGNLTRRGYGWKMVGGAGSRFIELQAHNGTTLSSVTSSFAVTAGVAFDWDIESDGAGNVTLYVNGSSVAASTGGPTGSVSITGVAWQEEVAAAAALSSPYLDFVNSRGRYIVINTW